jgi:carbonic anhydrase
MSQIDGPAAAIAEAYGTGPEAGRRLEEVAIRQSLANLRSFPFVREREDAGRLMLLGGHFSISDGQLYMLDEAEDVFRPVSTD